MEYLDELENGEHKKADIRSVLGVSKPTFNDYRKKKEYIDFLEKSGYIYDFSPRIHLNKIPKNENIGIVNPNL